MDNLIDRSDVEQKENWRHVVSEIPFIEFPRGWKVAVIPPFGGALARFLVKKKNGHKVSVYLDWYARLGAMNHPYWEVYPHGGDVFRCHVNDTDALIQAIKESKPE